MDRKERDSFDSELNGWDQMNDKGLKTLFGPDTGDGGGEG